MFKKHPETYRGTVCVILSVLVIALFLVQFYFITVPSVPIKNWKTEEIENYSMAEVMFTKTDDITELFKKLEGWQFSINPYADMTAYAIALGIATTVMSLISLKCFATHIVSVIYAFWSISAWSNSKIWEIATLPIGATIHNVINITMWISMVLIVARTVIYLVYRFAIPFVKWRKATNEWKVIYEEAKAAEAAAAEAAAAETAAN